MIERKQVFVSRMELRRKRIFIPLCVIIALSALIAIIYCIFASYKPPKHEKDAVSGVPSPEESYLYGTVETEFGYKISMAANLYRQENGDVNIFFTNPESNNVYLVCEILDSESKKTLHKTGYIKPGEYITSISDKRIQNISYKITVRVYAYDMNNFTSFGTTDLQLLLQPW